MKLSTLAALALFASATLAQAHTHVKESQPADGSILKAPPESIVLRFSEATHVTSLTLQKEGEAEQKLSALPAAAVDHVTVPVPKLGPGKYVVSWRGVGDDNHIMSGKLHFTIDPSATPAAGKPSAGDGASAR